MIATIFLALFTVFLSDTDENTRCIYYCEVVQNTSLYYGASNESKVTRKIEKGDRFVVKNLIRDFIKVNEGFIHSSNLIFYEDCSNNNKLLNASEVNSKEGLNTLKGLQLNISLMAKKINNK